MRSLDMRGPLRRRWALLVAGLLATCALAVAAFAQVGPSREIRSSALLLPPAVSVVAYPDRETTSNPFLRLDGIDPALSVLVTKMMADETSDRLLEGASQTTYVVAQDPRSQAPLVVVTVSGKDATEAQNVLGGVTEEMPRVLEDLQDGAGVPRAARISLVPLVQDEKPKVVWGGLVRLEILVVGVGLVGTLLLTGLWDALARSRAARREAAEGTPEEGESSTVVESEEPVERESPEADQGDVSAAKARV